MMSRELEGLLTNSREAHKTADRADRLYLKQAVIERRAELISAYHDDHSRGTSKKFHSLNESLVNNTTDLIASMCARLAQINRPSGDDECFDYWPSAIDLMVLLKDILMWSDYHWKPGPITERRNTEGLVLDADQLSCAANIYPNDIINEAEYLCAMWGVPTRRAEYMYDEPGEVYLATYFEEE